MRLSASAIMIVSAISTIYGRFSVNTLQMVSIICGTAAASAGSAADRPSMRPSIIEVAAPNSAGRTSLTRPGEAAEKSV